MDIIDTLQKQIQSFILNTLARSSATPNELGKSLSAFWGRYRISIGSIAGALNRLQTDAQVHCLLVEPNVYDSFFALSGDISLPLFSMDADTLDSLTEANNVELMDGPSNVPVYLTIDDDDVLVLHVDEQDLFIVVEQDDEQPTDCVTDDIATTEPINQAPVITSTDTQDVADIIEPDEAIDAHDSAIEQDNLDMQEAIATTTALTDDIPANDDLDSADLAAESNLSPVPDESQPAVLENDSADLPVVDSPTTSLPTNDANDEFEATEQENSVTCADQAVEDPLPETLQDNQDVPSVVDSIDENNTLIDDSFNESVGDQQPMSTDDSDYPTTDTPSGADNMQIVAADGSDDTLVDAVDSVTADVADTHLSMDDQNDCLPVQSSAFDNEDGQEVAPLHEVDSKPTLSADTEATVCDDTIDDNKDDNLSVQSVVATDEVLLDDATNHDFDSDNQSTAPSSASQNGASDYVDAQNQSTSTVVEPQTVTIDDNQDNRQEAPATPLFDSQSDDCQSTGEAPSSFVAHNNFDRQYAPLYREEKYEPEPLFVDESKLKSNPLFADIFGFSAPAQEEPAPAVVENDTPIAQDVEPHTPHSEFSEPISPADITEHLEEDIDPKRMSALQMLGMVPGEEDNKPEEKPAQPEYSPVMNPMSVLEEYLQTQEAANKYNFKSILVSVFKDITPQQIESPQMTVETPNGTTFGELREEMRKKGYIVSQYVRQNTYQYYNQKYINVNKLHLATSLITYLFALIMIVVGYFAVEPYANIGWNYYVITAAVLLLIPAYRGIRYAIYKDKHAPANFSFKLSFATSLMASVIAIVVVMLFAFFVPGSTANISDVSSLIAPIFYPAAVLLLLPISVIVYALLYRSKRFHL